MRMPLVLLFLFISFLSFGQKRLVAKSEIKYNEVGSVFSIDSTSYFYSSWYNSLSEFKPIFKHATGFSYLMADRVPRYKVHCDSAMLYQSQSYPLYYNSTVRNVVSNGLLSESKINANLEYQYAYNYAGLETLSVTKYAGSINDSTFYTYDSLGNSKTKTIYPFAGSTIPNFGPSFIDSSFYIPNTNRVTKRVTYLYDQSSDTYYIVDLWEFTYSGTKIDFIDFHRKNGNGGTYWYQRIEYEYLGDRQTSQTTYIIQGNSPSYVLTRQDFEYSPSGNLIKVLRTKSDITDTTIVTLLKYDQEGFVQEVSEFMSGFQAFFLFRHWKYYYQSKESLPQNEDPFVILHPNPVVDELTIQTSSELIEVEILNLLGQIVLSQKTNVLNVKNLSPGEYYVRGITENGTFSEAFIKN